ncbi:MAG TPA: protein phosphatase 2C domain-containing protein [Streptomyces sp.]|nr:protein phosphatase 2C domain-containing protein [Streptomyces sp.]
MSQQGERADGPDWWGRLYGDGAPDTGRAPADDSVDERFDSAVRTVRPEEDRAVGPAPPDGGKPAPPAAPPPPSPESGPPEVNAPAAPAPAHEPEPTTLPAADPGALAELVPDTVLDGARYGSFTLRAASVRGVAARHRGEPRRDVLLTARFGSGESALVLVAVAGGGRTAAGTHRAALEICHRIGASVGRGHVRLSEDVRAARRGALKSGLHRLTGHAYGKLRARAAELGLEEGESAAGLRCLLLPADPACRVRVFFGVGEGGLFRLRDGVWRDIDPGGHPALTSGGTVPGTGPRLPPGWSGDGPAPEAEPGPFRFRTSLARPGDTLLLCSAGLAEPMRGQGAFAARLAERWLGPEPPGLARFLADIQLWSGGYGEDRTAAAVWEH